MILFQSITIKKYLKIQNKTGLHEKWEAYKVHFKSPSILDNICKDKGKQHQEGFSRHLFVHILDYRLNPEKKINTLKYEKHIFLILSSTHFTVFGLCFYRNIFCN